MTKSTKPVVVVAGAGGGIGSATARTLAGQGFSVVCWDVVPDTVAAVAESLPSDCSFTVVDATDFEAVSVSMSEIVESRGRLDAVVSTVGWTELHPFSTEDPSYWQRVIALNLETLFNITHAAWLPMVEMGGGRLVAFASDAGRVGQSGEAVYSAAKGGVIAFMKAIAREGARYGITANTVSPGPTATQMMGDVGGDELDRVLRHIPLRRLATPDEQATAAAFFCSPETRMITGQTLSVSGGLTML